MKHLLFFLLAFPFLASAQILEKQFVATVQYNGFTQINDSLYRGDLIEFRDVLIEGYQPSSVDSGFICLDGTGRAYRVEVVNSFDYSSLNVDLIELDDYDEIPTGVGIVAERYGSTYQIPNGLVNSIGISAVLQAKILNHNTKIAATTVQPPDTLYLQELSGTTAISDGDTIPLIDYVRVADTTTAFASYLKRPVGWGLSLLTGKYPLVDSLKVASRYHVGANFFPLQGGTLTGTGGVGFIGLPAQSGTPSTPASGFRLFANGAHNLGILDRNGWITTFDISATANRDFTYPSTGGTFALGTGTADRLARWTATNTLGPGNLSDNGTKLQALLPWQFHSWTTAGRPTGVSAYIGDNSTNDWFERYSTVAGAWISPLQSSLTGGVGTATRLLFNDANGRATDNAAATINLTGVLGRMEIRGSIDQKTFVVRRTNSSQTTNVFEVASESGGSITSINALGYINSTDLRLQNNGRTAFRGVTNFSTFADNVASTFFQVSNSSDGNRLLFTSESGNPLARLAFLSTGAYVYNGSFASSPAPVSQFAVINTVSATQPMTIKLANPQNVDAFRITSSANVKLFHVENDGKVSIKNSTTAARDLDVNGEVRIRDLTTDSPVDIVGADGDGDLGRFSLSGLSVSGGTLTAQNIGNTNLTLSGNRTLTGAGYWLKYPNMEFNIGDTTWLFSKGVRPYLYARSKTYKPNQDSVAGQIILNTNGPQANLQLFGSANASNNFSGAIFLYDLSANTAKNKGWFVANDQRDLTEDGLNFKQVGTGFSGFNTHYIMRNNGTFTVGAPTLSPVMAISHDTVLIGKLPIINANINGNVAYSEAPFKVVNLGIVGSPSASNKVIVNAKFYIGTDSTLKFDPANDLLQLSQYGTGTKEAADLSKTQSAYIAGIATDGTLLDYPISSLANGIYSGSGTLSQTTTRASIPDNGNLLFSQTYNTTDSAYIQVINGFDGNREVRIGLTDTASAGFAVLTLKQDADNGVMAWDLRSSDNEGQTRLTGDGGNISATVDEGYEIQLSGMVRSKREAYSEITSTSSPQTLSNTYSDNLINQSGTQATFTLEMPASPEDGQICTITFNNAISTLTIDGNGETIVGSAVTTGVPGSQRKFKFYSGIGWIKLY